MIAWLRAFFGCGHRATYRERRKRQLVLVCHDCDRVFPVELSDTAKGARLRRRLKLSARTPVTRRKADVYVLPKRGQQ